jgi:hypothetical protein
MKKRVVIFSSIVFVLAFIPLYLSGISTPDTAAARTDALSPTPSSSEVSSGISSHANLIRNLWGAPKDENVALTLTRSENALSWSWKRENPVRRPGVDYIQPIYPNARIVLDSPVNVGDIDSFKLFADYDFVEKPTGSYNVAFDIFLREPGTMAIRAEIMVWLNGTQKQPALSLKGSCSDGTNTYKKYWWTTSAGWAYRSFLLSKPIISVIHSVNLKALINLIEADDDWYISEVELGTEVWSGSGAIDFDTFYLRLNGNNY